MKNRRNNIVYWRLRETEAKRRYIREEVAYNKELEKIYLNVHKSIEKEINSFYSRYAGKEGISLAEAKKRANQLDMDYYSNKAKEYVKNRDFSRKANAEMRLYNMTMKANRLELLKANIGLEKVAGFNQLESLMDKGLNKRTLDEIKRQAGILGKTVGDNKKLAKEIVNASFKNATFSDRIWMHQSLLKNKLDALLQTGLIKGLNPKELAQGLNKIFSVSRRDALRLMQTELCRVQTSAQKSSYEANGYEYFEFIGDQSGACEICRSLDGKRFKVKDMLVGENAPPVHPHCRCSTSAATVDKVHDAWEKSSAAKNGVLFDDFKSLYAQGNSKILFEKGYKTTGKANAAEIEIAHWLTNTLGGNIKLLKRSLSKPTPDYEWNEKYWDLKTPQSSNGTDKLVHHGLHQIKDVPGGIIVDCSNEGVNTRKAMKLAEARLRRSGKDKKIRIIIKDGNEIIAILK